ncbi:MAG: hypothetical protein LUH54_04350 [Firmicutes bacterium]|nr:hypothetical protein [Bacillota bacterium]
MKSYKEVAEDVFKKRDEYEKKQRERRRIITRVSAAAACLFVVIGISTSVYLVTQRSNEDGASEDGLHNSSCSEAYYGAEDGDYIASLTDAETDLSASDGSDGYDEPAAADDLDGDDVTDAADDKSEQNSTNPKTDSDSDDIAGEESIVTSGETAHASSNLTESRDDYFEDYEDLKAKLTESDYYPISLEGAFIALQNGEAATLSEEYDYPIVISSDAPFGYSRYLMYTCVDVLTEEEFMLMIGDTGYDTGDDDETVNFEYEESETAEISLESGNVTAEIYSIGDGSVIVSFEYTINEVTRLVVIYAENGEILTEEFFSSISISLLN